jgi:hypothetical protein
MARQLNSPQQTQQRRAGRGCFGDSAFRPHVLPLVRRQGGQRVAAAFCDPERRAGTFHPPVFSVDPTITTEGEVQFPIFFALAAAVGVAMGGLLATWDEARGWKTAEPARSR